MTTILATAAVVLLAILISVCVFGYLRLSALLKADEEKDEVKAQPGPYHDVCDFDVRSMHPSSCISEKPFSYKYSNTFDSLYWIRKRINDLAERVSHSEDRIDLNFNEHYVYEKRIEKLEKLVQQLFDETVNQSTGMEKPTPEEQPELPGIKDQLYNEAANKFPKHTDYTKPFNESKPNS